MLILQNLQGTFHKLPSLLCIVMYPFRGGHHFFCTSCQEQASVGQPASDNTYCWIRFCSETCEISLCICFCSLMGDQVMNTTSERQECIVSHRTRNHFFFPPHCKNHLYFPLTFLRYLSFSYFSLLLLFTPPITYLHEIRPWCQHCPLEQGMVIPQRLLSPEEWNNDSISWSSEPCLLWGWQSFVLHSSRK